MLRLAPTSTCCSLSWLLLACASAPSPSMPAPAPSAVRPARATAGLEPRPATQPVASSALAPRERPYEYDDPERDTDRDGIADPEDRCPTEPGQESAESYGHGCPKAYREPKGPSGGIMVRLEPGSTKLPNDQGPGSIRHLADLIIKHDMCALAVSYTVIEDATRLSVGERKLGVARVETLRQLLLKQGLPDARIRLAPNTYPRDFIRRAESPEQFRDGVVVFPRRLSECDAPFQPP